MAEVKVLTSHCRKIRKTYTLRWHKEAIEREFKNEYKMLVYYYWKKMMSTNIMARCLDSTQFTILNRLKKFKIKRRPVGGTNHVKRKEKKL
uniref:Uncharacterized protein n=1 Tax=viral metagenome TaxID=1070528 RepID=A0A6H1ZBM4_9ZZZZ